MKRSDFGSFYKNDFVDISLHDQLLEELVPLSKLKPTNIDQNGVFGDIYQDDREYNLFLTIGHIRNWCDTDDGPLDSLLPPGFKRYKDICKQAMIENGMKNPVARSMIVFTKPSVAKWHKDYISPEMQTDPRYRWISFYVLSEEPPKSTFMVSPGPDGPGPWKLGFKVDLATNMVIAHNQNLGHEYLIMEETKTNILTIIWYDIV